MKAEKINEFLCSLNGLILEAVKDLAQEDQDAIHGLLNKGYTLSSCFHAAGPCLTFFAMPPNEDQDPVELFVLEGRPMPGVFGGQCIRA